MGKTNLTDGNFLFRFRSSTALLEDDPERGGFLELERQEIFFARPESLNDPLEGLTDAFWDGDNVLWENFVRHYALSLLWYAAQWFLSTPEEIDRAKVSAALTVDDLPTDAFREIYREYCSDFCSHVEAPLLASMLAQFKVPLRRARLVCLLMLLHQPALTHLFRVLKKHALTTFELPPLEKTDDIKVVLEGWKAFEEAPPTSEMPVEHQLEIMGHVINRTQRQLELGMLSRADDQRRAGKVTAIMARFPEMYVEAFLSDLHFTPWRVACFSRQCVNASMWGSYGDEHRGAALVFRTIQRDKKQFFKVQKSTGADSSYELEVRPVIYQKQPPPLDSFLEMGLLPMPKLERTWMKSDAGSVSVRLQEMNSNIEAWRKAHWQKAFELATWKHPDWAHEDELRVIVSTVFTEDPAPHPLKYNFSQLAGIVFGMRMSTSDRLRTARVVEMKCRREGRSDFRFFQAHYSPQKGEMEIAELGLLTF